MTRPAAHSHNPTGSNRTIRSAASRAVEVLHESGPRVLAEKVFAELFYRRLVVYQAELRAPRPSIQSRLPLRFDVLGTDQVADYLACRPGADARLIERRMSADERCYVARLEGEVVAVSWVRFGDVKLSLSLVLPLAEWDAYRYDTYTRPQWRRNGVANALLLDVMDRLEAEGYRRLFSAWFPENTEAASLNPRRGRRLAVLRVLRLGRHWWYELRPHPASARGRFHRLAGASRWHRL
jgi:GNAT superfamily N-acetyltransferase